MPVITKLDKVIGSRNSVDLGAVSIGKLDRQVVEERKAELGGQIFVAQAQVANVLVDDVAENLPTNHPTQIYSR